MKSKYTAAIIILLALHLMFVNTEIIIKLLRQLIGRDLSFLQIAGTVIFSLSYSLITVLIIKVYPNPYVFITTAAFDGFAVFLNYSSPVYFQMAAAVYLGLYTSLIIASTGFIEKQNKLKTEEKHNKTELIRELTRKKTSLTQAIRRVKDENRKKELQNQLQTVTNQLQLLTN